MDLSHASHFQAVDASIGGQILSSTQKKVSQPPRIVVTLSSEHRAGMNKVLAV